MTSLGRIFACMFTAGIFGYIGLLVVAIFGPLIFPWSLTDPSRTENFVLGLGFVLAALPHSPERLVLCRNTTRRSRVET
jgi:sugar lactone lactonase YvrE